MERLSNIGAIVIFLLLICLVFALACDSRVKAIAELKAAPALKPAEPTTESKDEEEPEGSLKLTPQERAWVERVIMAEARGEPWEGQVAVAQVIRDRVRHPGFPDSVIGVLLQCNQFAEPYESTISADVKEAVRYVFDFGSSIFPGTLLYFMNPRKASTKGAEWIRSSNVLKVVIGNHEFYGKREG